MADSNPRKTTSAAPRALLALVNAAEQMAVEQVLKQEGFEVGLCRVGSHLIEDTKHFVPDLLLIDADRPDTDLASISRILNRYYATRAVVMVLVVPASVERHRIERLRLADPFAILARPLTYAILAQTAREALERSDELKKEHGLQRPQAPSTTRHVPENNSLLVHEVTCRFHDEPVKLDRYVLRSGRVETELNFFDIPVYKKAARGADFVDFNLLNVTVCPQCLFASNDPSHFDDPAERDVKPVEFTPQTRSAVTGRIDVRRSLAAGLTQSFFTHERTRPQALVAFELAIDSAKTIYECNKYTMPLELLRLANYHLRLVQLHQDMGAPGDKIEAHTSQAIDWLKQAFLLLEGPALFKTIYQLVATSIWTYADHAAHQYMSRLQELEREPNLPKQVKAAAERYLARCKTAWEDRDLHRSPNLWPPDSSEAEAA